jgi:hypothetical protein
MDERVPDPAAICVVHHGGRASHRDHHRIGTGAEYAGTALAVASESTER